MNEIRQKLPKIREKRLSTLAAYHGSPEELALELGQEDVRQRIRTYSETTYDEIIYAVQALGAIRSSVTIINGPSGCGAAKLESSLRNGASPWLITNLEENDSILGGDDKLREAIERAYRHYRPDVIFVVTTPVIAINNDDVQSVVAELSDTLGIPVVPVYAAGFKSKNPVYGYDLVYHAIAKFLLSREETDKNDRINVIATGETKTSGIIGELKAAGIPVHPLAGPVKLADLKAAVSSKASIALDSNDANYLLRVLEEAYGVTSIGAAAPIGIANTGKWILAAADAAGTGAAAEAYVARRQAASQAVLSSVDLTGKRVFVDLPPEKAFGVADLIAELGGEVAAIAVTHTESLHRQRLERAREAWGSAQIYIQQGQPFEKVNLLKKLQPDLYIGRSEDAAWALQAGIPAVAVDSLDLYGYEGAGRLALTLARRLQNTALVRYLSAGDDLPYQEGWLKKSAKWYVKQEVK
ncbi:MAG: oxidoreductase/nitrogenase component 1 [Paenibacillaceae bacterium]|jgi:nitrogenase molybdenum-iron protein alpha/beta subunit|nr:oxidoreductase/nitrogenase component 1 [Paenibacillaceae bacterium]